MYRLLTVLAFVVILSGCASIGAEDYGCSGIPDGVTCISTRDVFDSSNSGSTPERVVKTDEDNERDSRDRNDDENTSSEKNSSQDVKSERVSDPVLDTFVTPRIPDKPIPIRTPAQVMRIWVATWEDKNSGALMAPGYVYTEVEPRKWVIGKPESAARQQGRIFKPLDKSSSIKTLDLSNK
jgi:conjugal transfer pilus assembly protein TraV